MKTKISDKSLFNGMPNAYLQCFSVDCPLADSCVRANAAQYATSPDAVISIVNHKVCCGDTCQYYKTLEVVRMAYGMKTIFNKVLATDIKALRQSIINHFGNGSYYARRNGKHPITPAEQDVIQSKFDQYGYTGKVKFDRYSDEVNW